MHFKNFIGAIAALALLGGCAAATSINDVEKLNDTAAVGSEFTRALATEYRELANFEQFEMYDYRDAKYHADKGLMAAQGEVVLPLPRPALTAGWSNRKKASSSTTSALAAKSSALPLLLLKAK